MRSGIVSAGRLAVALLSLTSFTSFVVASEDSLWPRWAPEADALVEKRATNDDKTSSASKTSDSDSSITDGPTSGTATNTNTADSDSSSNTNSNTDSDSDSSTGTDKTTGKGKSTSKKSTKTTKFAATDSTGSVVMITPTATSTTLIRLSEFATFSWNYTNLKGTPTAVDVAISCSLVSSTWILTQNMSFQTAGQYTWDTGAFQTNNIENPLPYDYFTLQIYDAAAGPSETAEPGFLAPYTAGATFGFYTGKPYNDIGKWVCATCNGAISPMERRFLGGAVAMSVLTVLTFTWFVTGVGALI